MFLCLPTSFDPYMMCMHMYHGSPAQSEYMLQQSQPACRQSVDISVVSAGLKETNPEGWQLAPKATRANHALTLLNHRRYI